MGEAGAAAAQDSAAPSPKEQQKRFLELTRQFEQDKQEKKIPLERSKAIRALGNLHFPPAVAYLTKALQEPKEDSVVKQEIIRALADDGSAEAVAAVIQNGFEALPARAYWMLRDVLVKPHGAGATTWLVETGYKVVPTLPPAGQVIVVETLLATNEPASGDAAVKLLAHRKCPPETQVALLKIVRRHQPDGAAKKVARLYRFDNKELQVAALRTLQKLEASEHSKTFLKSVESRYWEVRVAGADILGQTHDPAMIDTIALLLSDPVPQVQVAAAHALKEIGGRDAVDRLVAALDATEGRVRDDIADNLAWLTGQSYGVDPLAWQAWWKENRETAEVAGISLEEYEKLKEKEANSNTGTYYGLRVISQFVTFVIDVSGSMEEPYNVKVEKKKERRGKKGSTGVSEEEQEKKKKSSWVKRTKIEVARDELTQVLEGIRGGTQFNIIKFSGVYTPWQPSLTVMDDDIRIEAKTFVKDLTPGGETNVYDTLMYALSDPDVNTIYFLSDGQPTMGKTIDAKEILAAVSEANSIRKVKIHTIGFHLNPEAEKLMRQLAAENYGTFVSR